VKYVVVAAFVAAVVVISIPILLGTCAVVTIGGAVNEAQEERAGGVTMAQFQRIQVGMPQAEAERILGGPGELMSENEIPGVPGFSDPVRTAMYSWDGRELLSSVNIMFQSGKVFQRSQFGLK